MIFSLLNGLCITAFADSFQETESNNYIGSANIFSIGDTIVGSSQDEDIDFFAFTAPKSGIYKFSTDSSYFTDSSSDWYWNDFYINLFDSNGTEIDNTKGTSGWISFDDNFGCYKDSFSYNLTAGTYYVRIHSYNDCIVYSFATSVEYNDCSNGHKWTTRVIKPTLAAKGYTLHKCARCGKSYKDNYTAKLTVKKTSISKLTKGKKSFTATWKKVSGITGYQIQYSLNSNMKNSKTITIKGTKKTVKKLKSKKKYYVRVRAYQTYNGKKYYSSWSKVKTVKTK